MNVGGKIAFLSTPSVYFALPDEARAKSYCFDVSIGMSYKRTNLFASSRLVCNLY